VSYPRRLETLAKPLWKHQISHAADMLSDVKGHELNLAPQHSQISEEKNRWPLSVLKRLFLVFHLIT
jgi:hypothetical protein